MLRFAIVKAEEKELEGSTPPEDREVKDCLNAYSKLVKDLSYGTGACYVILF